MQGSYGKRPLCWLASNSRFHLRLRVRCQSANDFNYGISPCRLAAHAAHSTSKFAVCENDAMQKAIADAKRSGRYHDLRHRRAEGRPRPDHEGHQLHGDRPQLGRDHRQDGFARMATAFGYTHQSAVRILFRLHESNWDTCTLISSDDCRTAMMVALGLARGDRSGTCAATEAGRSHPCCAGSRARGAHQRRARAETSSARQAAAHLF
jgi:hypothetical protein